MEKIKIITDSGSDIPQKYVDELDISMLPLDIIIDGKVYRDRIDLESREYMRRIRTMDKIPTTSMVPMELMKAEFLKNLETYDHQIYVTISSASSGTYNVACMIKKEIEEETGKPSNITIIDSYSFTMVYGTVVMKIAEMAKQGASYEEILQAYNYGKEHTTAYFIVDDLKHLQKGGRINPGVAIIGSLLGIKPILTINNGLVDSVGKERGKNRALEKIADMMIAEIKNPEEQTIIVPNGDADEDVKTLVEIVKSKIQVKGFEEFDLGCTIGTHSGAGLVGLIFSK